MGKLDDIVGLKFGRLTVIEIVNKSSKNISYLCKCDCGNIINVYRFNLKNGVTKSCGCLRNEFRRKNPPVNKGFIDNTCINYITNNKLACNNVSGVKGVCWDKSKQKWRVDIQFKKKKYYLSSYVKLEDAKRIRKEAEDKLFGGFIKWYNSIKK